MANLDIFLKLKKILAHSLNKHMLKARLREISKNKLCVMFVGKMLIYFSKLRFYLYRQPCFGIFKIGWGVARRCARLELPQIRPSHNTVQ
jgi:hypothetical protein